jgi:hypothetical protein
MTHAPVRRPRWIPRTGAEFGGALAATALVALAAGFWMRELAEPAAAPPRQDRPPAPEPAPPPESAEDEPEPPVIPPLPPVAEADSPDISVLRADPAFRDHGAAFARGEPFLVARQFPVFTDAAERHKNSERAARAEKTAANVAVVQRHVLDRWNREIGSRLDLEASARPLHTVVLWDEGSLLDAHGRFGPFRVVVVPLALYAASERTAFALFDGYALRSSDEIPCAGGFVQKKALQSAAEVAAAALLHGASTGDAADVFPRRVPPWFMTGFCAWLGGVEVDAEHKDDLAQAQFRDERIRLDVVALAREQDLREPARLWTVAKLLAIRTDGDVPPAAEKLVPGRGGDMQRLFRARAWALVHFLRNYDDGRYRDRLVAFTGKALRGEATAASFARLMGRSDASSWGDVEREYEWYWSELLKRRVGWKTKGRTSHWETVTEAPLGRVPE